MQSPWPMSCRREMLKRQSMARIELDFPCAAVYLKLIKESEWALSQLRIGVYIVAKKGTARSLLATKKT